MPKVREAASSGDRFLGLLADYQRRLEALERKVHEAAYAEVPFFNDVIAAGRVIDWQRPGERCLLGDGLDWGTYSTGPVFECVVYENASGDAEVAMVATGPVLMYSPNQKSTGTACTSTGYWDPTTDSKIEMPPGFGTLYGTIWAGVYSVRAHSDGDASGRVDVYCGFREGSSPRQTTASRHEHNQFYTGGSMGGWHDGDFGWARADGNLNWWGQLGFLSDSGDSVQWSYPVLAYYPRSFKPS